MKISGVAAVLAFILSLLIGLISRAAMPMLIIRPLIFAVLFFLISGLVSLLVNHFLPELQEDGGRNDEIKFSPGAHLNISEDDLPGSDHSVNNYAGKAAPVRAAQPDDSEDNLGNITELVRKRLFPHAETGNVPTGMDQNGSDGYTKLEESEDYSGQEQSSPGKSLSESDLPFAGDSDDVSSGSGVSAAASRERKEAKTAGTAEKLPDSMDFLPDLDSMAGAFLSADGEEESDTTEFSVSTPPLKPSSANKAPSWAGDFNAKDMAAGLRTVINKDKEG